MPDREDLFRIAELRIARRERELHQFVRRLAMLLVVLCVLVLAGAIGYAASEHTSVPYGFFWTLDTVTTLGVIPQPHDTGGRVLQACLELFGIGGG